MAAEGVTEHLLDGLDVRAVGHGQAGGGVSQLVTTRGRGIPWATFRVSRPSRTAAARARDSTRWA